ncbi:MAG TPA: type II toxin-antitoxin system VapC family toxin [Dehalococcoidia bacterium]|jgi:predicted nucleic acid-binding protein|nr:type II toxin-antitoxin system VapC family toxin [Dehalococcoidia bacterium]
MAASVVDASALGAVAFGEPDAEPVAEQLAGEELFAPSLVAYELASVARKKVLARPEQREAIAWALEQELTLDVQRIDVDQPAVLELALEAEITTYDASYLWLAR